MIDPRSVDHIHYDHQCRYNRLVEKLYGVQKERDALDASLEALRQAGNRVIRYHEDPAEWDAALAKAPLRSLQDEQLARLTVVDEAIGWIMQNHPGAAGTTLALLSHYTRQRRKEIMQ